jgi:hypothetical protein
LLATPKACLNGKGETIPIVSNPRGKSRELPAISFI